MAAMTSGSPSPGPDRAQRAADTAAVIARAFEEYNQEFRTITQRARRRFEEREWQLGQRDAVERIELYDRRVERCVAGLVGRMGALIADASLWKAIRSHYSALIAARPDSEFYKTFFNSITRKIFDTVGANPDVEFLALDVEPTFGPENGLVCRYPVNDSLAATVAEVLERAPAPHRMRDRLDAAGYVTGEIGHWLRVRGLPEPVTALEMLEPVFYRGTRAYLVGRMRGTGWLAPLVIALRNDDEGIAADAVIMSDPDVRMLFGFSRSYFHADLPTVSAAVSFLHTIMPRKAIDELYTVLGRAKQGKTERYRNLFRHLQSSSDQFVHAEGERGMVMIVFTLRSWDIVFKVIRDRFPYPKSTSRQEVMEKYRLVFRHDRAGRLVDAQEFRRLTFPKARFAPALLDELLAEAGSVCRLDGDDVVIDHCYLERRLKPLNVYLQEAEPAAARRAIRDYGQAIRDLALSNVFPGDLLLKNFGVSRHGRVIFYDYDELCLVTDCSFRDLPAARNDEDELRAEPWFYVSPSDVFPGQFIDFLGLRGELKEEFLAHHADLLTAAYWRELRDHHTAERHLEVVPYACRPRAPTPALTAAAG
jgi:isocitrate dehydrogenase kinase/phosphatase